VSARPFELSFRFFLERVFGGGRGFSRDGSRLCVRTRKEPSEALEAAEKFGTGQEKQGLKPKVFSFVYGTTKVVP
jgi:hypothetical protein